LTLTVLSRAAAPAGQPAGAIPVRSTSFISTSIGRKESAAAAIVEATYNR